MFGQRLRELIKANKLTFKEFGEKFNLAESTISGYVNGTRKPDIDLIKEFADFFQVSVDDLLARNFKPDSLIVETKNNEKPINMAFLGGRKEVLTEDEAEAVEAALEIHRKLKEKRMREKENK